MTPRAIHSLMRRHFYYGVSASGGYRHLVIDGLLSEERVCGLIDDYIATSDAIVYADRGHAAVVPVHAVFSLLQQYRDAKPGARVQVVATDLSARVVIESIGVGIGEHRKPALPLERSTK